MADKINKKDDPKETFSDLLSDKKLRQQAADLVCENLSDRRTLDIILEQKMLSGYQRVWIKRVLERKGAKFVYTEKIKEKV